MLCASRAYAKGPPILAVMNIEDHTGKFSPGQLELWRLQLAARITASEQYRLAAGDGVREQLARIKASAFREGFDDARQPDLGRELPAEKVLDVQLLEVGGACAVVGALYDLERAVADKAYSRISDCGDVELRRRFDELANTITGEDLPEPEIPEIPSTPSAPWTVSADFLSMGMGYGGTIGGAMGAVITGELFTLRYGPLHATLIDAGTTIFAEKGAVFEEVSHSMTYVGATAGVSLFLGGEDQHELSISGGGALYRAAAEADFFTGLKVDADETDGLVPAALLDARYLFHTNEYAPMSIAFGGGVRAVVPISSYTGDPSMILLRLFLSFGSR